MHPMMINERFVNGKHLFAYFYLLLSTCLQINTHFIVIKKIKTKLLLRPFSQRKLLIVWINLNQLK
jgi:hypothetical protein